MRLFVLVSCHLPLAGCIRPGSSQLQSRRAHSLVWSSWQPVPARSPPASRTMPPRRCAHRATAAAASSPPITAGLTTTAARPAARSAGSPCALYCPAAPAPTPKPVTAPAPAATPARPDVLLPWGLLVLAPSPAQEGGALMLLGPSCVGGWDSSRPSSSDSSAATGMPAGRRGTANESVSRLPQMP